MMLLCGLVTLECGGRRCCRWNVSKKNKPGEGAVFCCVLSTVTCSPSNNANGTSRANEASRASPRDRWDVCIPFGRRGYREQKPKPASLWTIDHNFLYVHIDPYWCMIRGSVRERCDERRTEYGMYIGQRSPIVPSRTHIRGPYDAAAGMLHSRGWTRPDKSTPIVWGHSGGRALAFLAGWMSPACEIDVFMVVCSWIDWILPGRTRLSR